MCPLPIRRKPDEPLGKWKRRQTCGPACAQKLRLTARGHQRTEPEPKPCGVCGAMFSRRPTEDLCDFKHRMACCTEHSHALRRLAPMPSYRRPIEKTMPPDVAERVMSMPPAHVMRQIEQLPEAERRKAIEGWMR